MNDRRGTGAARRERREDSKPGGAQPGHEGRSRNLCERPDAIEEYALTRCLRCLRCLHCQQALVSGDIVGL